MSLRITEGRPGRKRQRTGKPDFWFDALTAFTGENPVDPDCNFDESVDAWLEWGNMKGIIASKIAIKRLPALGSEKLIANRSQN